MNYYQHVPFEVYEDKERRAGEQMALHWRQLRENILKIAPEATFTIIHGEVIVDCRTENADRVVQLLTGGML